MEKNDVIDLFSAKGVYEQFGEQARTHPLNRVLPNCQLKITRKTLQ